MPADPNFFCVDLCRAVGEKLPGTATRVDVWLLLENTRPWGFDAFPESDLSPDVKAHLGAHLKAIPNSRMQFIKQSSRTTAAHTFYVAIANDSAPHLYKFQLDGYEGLLGLDIAAIVSGEAFYDSFRSDERVIICCTNAKRDRSCARYGLPMVDALTKAAQGSDVSVWQTTHIGGHRFAATLSCLPHGLTYGYLEPADAATIVEDYRASRITLEHYRGRSCYDEAVQAAEYYLYQQANDHDMGAFRLLETQPLEGDRWLVRFQSLNDGVHSVEVARVLSDFEIYKSSADAEKTRVPEYRYVTHELVET
ncbi:MAG: hypothetical protein H7175_08105 [Burkholderiales bacterium]|nr:hypothetical protein [Anaerolineae bacterium]